MGLRITLLLVCIAALAGCASAPVGTRDDLVETFTLSPKSTVSSTRTVEFDVLLVGPLKVHATSAPGPVLVVLQHKKDCGSFADQHFIPDSRYERTDIGFEYYVTERGSYCLTFQNRNLEPVDVTVTVSFPR